MKSFKVKTKTLLTLLIALFLVMPVSQDAWSQQPGAKPAAKERWIKVDIEASVEAVDRKKREVTLKDSKGNVVTIPVSEHVKRFNEIKVGDTVKVAYWTFLRAEFREPTAEEKANPLVVLAEAGRAPKDVDPAGVVGAVVRAVVRVVAIDTVSRQVAIQGPRGGIMVLPVMDDAVLKNLRLGEVLVMTYAEAVAVSLVKKK